MRECAGFGKPLVSSLPRPCIYPVAEVVVLHGQSWPACYFHAKVYAGLITDAGGRPLSWSPNVPTSRVPLCGATVRVQDSESLGECGLPRDHPGEHLATDVVELMGLLRREWDLAGQAL